MSHRTINPGIERDGNIIILNAPEFLPKAEVDKIIDELEETMKKADCASRCAIILNFSNLSSTEMTVDQMARFIKMIVQYKIKNVVSVPPAPSVPGSKQVIDLLNKSLPIFGKKGIWVLIVDNVAKAKSSIESCLSPLSEETKLSPIKVQIAGRFDGQPINREIPLNFVKNPNLGEILNELNKNLQISVFTPDSMGKEKFYVILNGNRVSSIEQIVNNHDKLTIIQPLP